MFVCRFVLLITIVNIAISEDIDDDIRVNVHRPRQLPVYSYNHPPLFEEFENSPQSESYKVLIPRQVKSIETPTSSFLEDISRNSPASQDGSQIPVSVVYEKVSDVKPVAVPTGNKIKKRNHRRRNKDANKVTQRQNNVSMQQPAQTEFTKKQQEITTLKPTITPFVAPTTVASRDVTLFPKRPIEDSKRIEFQKRSRERPPFVKILEEKNFVYSHTGNFHYSYDSADGTKVSSRGELRNVNKEGAGEAVVGSVSYKDDEGNDYSLSYTADENGYRPVGAHLPTPPPIPPEIARALQYLATKDPENVTDSPQKS